MSEPTDTDASLLEVFERLAAYCAEHDPLEQAWEAPDEDLAALAEHSRVILPWIEAAVTGLNGRR
jgi:hypothetical protein